MAYPTPELPMASDFASVAMIILAVISFLLILCGLGILNYIMTSLALHRIAKIRQIPNPWLAWIPLGCDWIIGSIVDYHDAQKGIRRRWRVALLTMNLIFSIGFVFVYAALIATLFSVFMQTESMNSVFLSESEIALRVLGAIIPSYIALIAIMVVGMAWSISLIICLYKIYEETNPRKALKYILISLMVPMGSAICLSRCKNYFGGVKVEPGSAAAPAAEPAPAQEPTQE